GELPDALYAQHLQMAVDQGREDLSVRAFDLSDQEKVAASTFNFRSMFPPPGANSCWAGAMVGGFSVPDDGINGFLLGNAVVTPQNSFFVLGTQAYVCSSNSPATDQNPAAFLHRGSNSAANACSTSFNSTAPLRVGTRVDGG